MAYQKIALPGYLSQKFASGSRTGSVQFDPESGQIFNADTGAAINQRDVPPEVLSFLQLQAQQKAAKPAADPGAPGVAPSYFSATGATAPKTSSSPAGQLPQAGQSPQTVTGQSPGGTTAFSGGNSMAAVDDATARAYFEQQSGGKIKASDIDSATAQTYYQAMHPGSAPPAPETNALQYAAGVDPASEALRTAVAGSYLTPLQQAAGKPNAAQYQAYLDAYKKLDPTGAALRAKLESQVGSDLDLGSQLDPQTAREVEQGTRAAQVARGNVYGTPQMVQEAMTRGQAGLALRNQRMGAAQSYLQSGQSMGDTALALYNQQQNQLRASQQGALSYLSSGQTPYQFGSGMVNMAEASAANAAQGGPQYNPASLGAGYAGSQFPQYGLDIGAQAQNYYNSLAAYSGAGAPQKNRAVSAASGALSGAASGAMAGSAAGPGYGTLIGAGIGAVAGGAGGYFS